MKLTAKLPVEFQVVLVKGILAIDRSFINHNTINAWIQKNSNVVL